VELLFQFLVGHAVCDFILQGEVVGCGKSRRKNLRAEHGPEFPPWYVWLVAHALTHGGAVYLISGLWMLGVLETLLHSVIDHLKCEQRISFHLDQLLHIACKIPYIVLLT
jgi:hypothetical protein